MSTNINPQALKTFIVKQIGADKIAKDCAQKYGIDNDKFDEANTDSNEYLDLDEIVEDKDLYAQFATMYVEEQKNETAATQDKDKDKEEQAKVKDKNGAGV